MSYYQDLTPEQQRNILSAMAGLRLNASQGKEITRQEVNAAFRQATGKELSLEYMRDPAVVQMMSLLAPSRATTDFRSRTNPQNAIPSNPYAQTDSNLAVRGLPVPKPPAAGMPAGYSTRYSAKR